MVPEYGDDSKGSRLLYRHLYVHWVNDSILGERSSGSSLRHFCSRRVGVRIQALEACAVYDELDGCSGRIIMQLLGYVAFRVRGCIPRILKP